MLEIVFSDSAAGSLKCAQRFGRGKYRSGAASFFILRSDGRQPTEEELEEARRDYEEKQRIAWEKAVPLGGTAADVFGFQLALSVGKLREKNADEDTGFFKQRKKALEMLFGTFAEGAECVQLFLENAERNLKCVGERMAQGESVRIWYSSNPDELCGMYWFMSWLEKRLCESNLCGSNVSNEIVFVKLPEWEESENGDIIQRISFGEVAAENWHQYLPLQKKVTPAMRRFMAEYWKKLEQENAQLRTCLNGKLMSVSEDFYDDFVLREIRNAEARFMEASVVGKILGNYRLGISDSWIHLRIEELVKAGKLEVLEKAEEGEPSYRRVLSKT